ncbi:MAG: hypothetical protein ACLUR5_04670 [Eubacterium ventriosum]
MSSDIVNAFKGVEGRLKEVRFVVSAQNNYELIQHVIKKKVSDCKPWFQEQNNKEIIGGILQDSLFFQVYLQRKNIRKS